LFVKLLVRQSPGLPDLFLRPWTCRRKTLQDIKLRVDRRPLGQLVLRLNAGSAILCIDQTMTPLRYIAMTRSQGKALENLILQVFRLGQPTISKHWRKIQIYS